MIQKVEMFTVKCDNCGKLFEDEYQGFCAWNCENGAWDNASDWDWHKEDLDTHYCPDCYSFDDEGNLIIKKLDADAAS